MSHLGYDWGYNRGYDREDLNRNGCNRGSAKSKAIAAAYQHAERQRRLVWTAALGVATALVWSLWALSARAQDVELQSGTYTLDPSHTSIVYRVDHLGFSPFAGMFDKSEGSMTFDAADPTKSTLSITVKADSVDSNSDHLDDGLKSEKMFDAANHPDITFVATSIEKTGDDTGRITGDLTIKDVTKPVTLDTRFTGAGIHPFSELFTMGFYAEGAITRSEFGLNEWLPGVGDKVGLVIAAEFSKTE